MLKFCRRPSFLGFIHEDDLHDDLRVNCKTEKYDGFAVIIDNSTLINQHHINSTTVSIKEYKEWQAADFAAGSQPLHKYKDLPPLTKYTVSCHKMGNLTKR